MNKNINKDKKIFPKKGECKQSQKNTLRVQGGFLKGQVLRMPKKSVTRPSKSILKQSLFNTLHHIIKDSHFIEVFSGSGSIGIEAISRGAKRVLFIEKNKNVFYSLKENLKEVEKKIFKINSIKTPSKNTSPQEQEKLKIDFKCILADAFNLMDIISSEFSSKPPQPLILFFDPPFPIYPGFEKIYEDCFNLVKKLPSNSLIIFEVLSDFVMPKKIQDFCIIKVKRFGRSSLFYYSSKRSEYGVRERDGV